MPGRTPVFYESSPTSTVGRVVSQRRAQIVVNQFRLSSQSKLGIAMIAAQIAIAVLGQQRQTIATTNRTIHLIHLILPREKGRAPGGLAGIRSPWGYTPAKPITYARPWWQWAPG